jgi:hypothetical protein
VVSHAPCFLSKYSRPVRVGGSHIPSRLQPIPPDSPACAHAVGEARRLDGSIKDGSAPPWKKLLKNRGFSYPGVSPPNTTQDGTANMIPDGDPTPVRGQVSNDTSSARSNRPEGPVLDIPSGPNSLPSRCALTSSRFKIIGYRSEARGMALMAAYRTRGPSPFLGSKRIDMFRTSGDHDLPQYRPSFAYQFHEPKIPFSGYSPRRVTNASIRAAYVAYLRLAPPRPK